MSLFGEVITQSVFLTKTMHEAQQDCQLMILHVNCLSGNSKIIKRI